MKCGRILGSLRVLISEKFPYSLKMFSEMSANSVRGCCKNPSPGEHRIAKYQT